MIPRIDARRLADGDKDTLEAVRRGAEEVGFLTVHDTALGAERVREVIETYRAFFHLPEKEKRSVDMARTGSNRGWGAQGSEQVDPEANPDYKQVFDCGFQLPEGDPLAEKRFYAPNQWPERPEEFHETVRAYYLDALDVARGLLDGVARAIGRDAGHFDGAFDRPMALLRGNYYPARPGWAGPRDFGIATHTDYGCLTLLATDGSPGLEVRKRGGGWIPVSAPPGEFIINFGEMLEFWTSRRVIATPHRVVGGDAERISVPMFFNPRFDVNVAPEGEAPILAGEHLGRRFEETYLHLKAGARP